jgi:hypothetical protein
LLLTVAAAASAQPTVVDLHPGKVRIASTAADALCVGASSVSPASSSCTGGVYAGPITANGILTVSGFGTHAFSAGGAGGNVLSVQNTTAGTTNAGKIFVGNDLTASLLSLEAYSSSFTSGTYNIANGAAVFSTGVGGLTVMASNGSGVLRFIAGGTAVRWGINAAGDHTFGPSAHIADSSGTPSINSCSTGATVSGTDYAMTVAMGASVSGPCVMNFGHTFNTAPVCVVNTGSGQLPWASATTTTVEIQTSGTYASFSGSVAYLLCRGY